MRRKRLLRQGLSTTFLGSNPRVIILAIARAADSFGNMFLIVIIPLYIASGIVDVAPLLERRILILGISLTEALLIGVLLSLFGFLSSLGQPFVGRVSDRSGRRRVYILIGLALLAGGNAAFAFVTDYRLLIAIRAIQGIGSAFAIPCTIALVNEFTADEYRGGNFGVFNTFRLLGVGTGPIVAGLVVGASAGGTAVYSFDLAGLVFTASGFDVAFYIAAGSALVSFTLIALFVADPEQTHESASKDLSVNIRDPERKQLLDPVFAVGVATLFMSIGLTLFTTLEPIINERLAQSETMFAVQFAAATVANIVFQVPIGRASDRIGRRPFLLAGFVVLVPATLAQGFTTSQVTMILARFVQGVGIAFVFAPGLAFAGDVARSGASGTQLAVLTTAFGLGVAIGPLASGYLVRFGFAAPFTFGAVLGVVGFLLVYTQIPETTESPIPINQDRSSS